VVAPSGPGAPVAAAADAGPPIGDKGRMESTQADAYLRRIGAERPTAADTDALRALHLRHLLAVPFENLSIHLGQDIVLEEAALVEKVVGAGRGGFCYELGGAFAALLRSLGFGVDLLAARVFGDGGRLGPPYDHLALRVTTADGAGPWLADVGFGRHSSYPLDYGSRSEQPDPGGVFHITKTPEGDLDVSHDGVPVYRLEQRPRALGDFEATCWWQRTSPASHFRQSLVCSRLTEEGRVTLSGRKLVLTSGQGGEGGREERELGGREVLAAYREHFGIALDHEPVVAPIG
jgi:N-hydroxyarylamine O-acetyltransferase